MIVLTLAIMSGSRHSYFCLGSRRMTNLSPLQSSISWPSTSCFAHTVASSSPSQTNARELIKCPSSSTMKARYSAIAHDQDQARALPSSLSPNVAARTER